MRLPHLPAFARHPIVFLTTCTEQRRALLARGEVHEILRRVWVESAARNGWHVGEYVVMPDHVHLFTQPALQACSLSSWMRIWKSVAALQMQRAGLVRDRVWQYDFFDRYLRSANDYQQKWEYVALNPVRKGLVIEAREWPYRGAIHDLGFSEDR